MGNYTLKYPSASVDVTLTYPTSSGTFALEGAGGFSVNNAGANRILFSDGTTSAATASSAVLIRPANSPNGLDITGSVYIRTDGTSNTRGRLELLGTDGDRTIIGSRGYLEVSASTATIDGGTGELALSMGTKGSIFKVDLNTNINSFAIEDVPTSSGGEPNAYALTIIFTIGGSPPYTISWGSIKWPGGTPPTPSAAAGMIDVYSIFTPDGGTTFYGFEGGLNFV